MNILADESIHSLIYRSHLLIGIDDYRNIINSKGLWIEFPKIKPGTLKIYKNIGEINILSILQRQALALSSKHRFDHPAPYKSDLEYFFGISRKNSKPNGLLVKFCMKCINEDIHNHGFSCFKMHWFNSSHCKKHSTPLFYIPKISRKNTLYCLEMIFRGETPESCLEVSGEEQGYFYLPPERRKKKQIYFSECLKVKFTFFLSQESFPPNLGVSERLRTLLERGHPPMFYMKKIFLAKNVFDALKNSRSEKLKSFLNNNSEIKHFYTGVLDENSIRESVLKSKTDDCNKCNYRLCHLNKERNLIMYNHI